MTGPGDYPFHWNRLDAATTPLNLTATLASGQSFRWRRDPAGTWWGAVDDVVIAARRDVGDIGDPPSRSALADCSSLDVLWQTFPERDRTDIFHDYFRTDVPLDALYAAWVFAEPRIAAAIEAYRGMRILRQPPDECFFAFQCAVCNTVIKIERSVSLLAARYGRPIDTGLASPPFEFYSFPSPDVLSLADESMLRADLWGYRAPRVISLAGHLLGRPPDWLMSMRELPYAEVVGHLTGLFGVGTKLADCVSLFALDKDEAVPIDTHTRQIAVRLFHPEAADRSLTPRVYAALADAYRSRFGAYAGWAQQYLFYGELRRA